ncbi:MAG: TatD family hydrolase [Patescibacteria group bacterium]
MRYIDCHTHVNFAAFKDDYKETITRAHEAGVFLVNVGTQKDTSRRAVEIANEYDEGVYATVGVHPIHTDVSHHDADELGSSIAVESFTSRGEDFDYEYYKKLALDKKVVAIGECGLDYAAFVRERRERLQKRASAETLSEGGLPQEDIEQKKEKQKEVFEGHIRLAGEVGKPLMIHCRDAFHDLIEVLISNSQFLISNPGIVHFFSGTKEDAKKLLDLGFSFTFGGVITFVRDYDEVIRFIPADRILSETDAPYVTPAPYRGKRNEPAYVIEVVKKLAELKGISVEDMRNVIWENATKVFSL